LKLLENVSPFVSQNVSPLPFYLNYFLYLSTTRYRIIMKASAKEVWDPKAKGDRRAIRLRVTFERQPRIYSLGSNRLLTRQEFDNRRTKEAKIAFDEVQANFQRALDIIEDLGDNFTFDEFTARYRQVLFWRTTDTSLFSSLVNIAKSKDIEEKTRIGYNTASNWIYKVFSDDIKTDDITPASVQKLIKSMKYEGISLNSIRIYMRALASIYSYGIERGLTKNDNPFKNIQGLTLTSTRRKNSALDKNSLNNLLLYKPKNASEQMGKDFFFLTYMLSGMNIGDILRLKNNAINNKDEITFIRHKTSRNQEETRIPLTKNSKNILNKYGRINKSAPNDYILPYLAGKTDNKTIANTINRIDKKINAGLKSISENLGIDKITTYNARHTFATHMRDSGMEPGQLATLMGHLSTKTTEIYLSTISTTAIEKSKAILEETIPDYD